MKESIAFNEMMVHIPLCTHKEAKNVLVIGLINDGFKKHTEKHLKESKFEFVSLEEIEKFENKSFDVVISNGVKLDLKVLADIYRVLKDDALIAFNSSSFSRNKEKLISDLKLVGEKFWIAMPFKFGHNTSIIASKKYHPTADINLQRADLLDDLEYYSSEMHLASFVFCASEHKALTGIAKR